MLGTRAKFAPRFDLAPLRDIAAQARYVLVVNFAEVIDAEAANLPPATEPAPARSPWSTTATARTTSAARTASAA